MIEELRNNTSSLEQQVDQAAEAEDYEQAESLQEQVDANTQLIERLEAELANAPEEEPEEPAVVAEYAVPEYEPS